MFKKVAALLPVILVSAYEILLAAEPGENIWTTGKVYVVLTVLATIFIGIILFLIFLERKMSNLEKKFSDK